MTQFKGETGYGFERGASVTAHERFVTSDKPFLFSVKLPEGNYRIAVTLGDDAEDSTNTVKAEARRLMLENVRAAKGQVVHREFTVNIRTPRISADNDVRLKQREKDSEQVTTNKPKIEKNPEYCQQARDNLQTLDTHARIRIPNEQGEYRYIDEAEKEEQRKLATETIAIHCEPSN